jgi:ferredoxin-NADP reductase
LGIVVCIAEAHDSESEPIKDRPKEKSMADYEMTLVDRQRIARDTMAFWFDTNGASFGFRGGQHADFVFTHPGMESESDKSRTFSLASSPQDKRPVMIAMRMRKTPFKTALKSAALGTKFIVSHPRGSFTLHRDITRPAVFLAGGIGIAPIRSIIYQATQERLPHKLYLFYSNREADDAAFIEEFESLTVQNPNFIFIPTVTGHRTIAWPYEKGHINHEMLTRYLLGLKGPIYYVAGPSGMVTAMTDLLNASGVSDDDVKSEEFGDYRLYQDPAQNDPGTSINRSDSAL